MSPGLDLNPHILEREFLDAKNRYQWRVVGKPFLEVLEQKLLCFILKRSKINDDLVDLRHSFAAYVNEGVIDIVKGL